MCSQAFENALDLKEYLKDNSESWEDGGALVSAKGKVLRNTFQPTFPVHSRLAKYVAAGFGLICLSRRTTALGCRSSCTTLVEVLVENILGSY